MADGNPDPRAQLDEVIRLCQAGALHDAELVCQGLVRSNPRLADAWNLLATILQQREEFEQSLAAAKRAVTLRSGMPPYWLTRGNAELGLGRFAAAAESLSRATRLAPNFAQAHMRLGVCRAAQGRPKDAIASYGEALRLAPEVAEIHYRLGEALAGERQWEAAAQFFQAAFVRDTQRALNREPGINCLRQIKTSSIVPFWRTELQRFFELQDVDLSRFVDIVVRVLKVTPPFDLAIGKVDSASAIHQLPATGLHEVMEDALLRLLLCRSVVSDGGLETLLTQMRAKILLDRTFCAGAPLGFVCALALQCFNNEYVYAESSDEHAQVETLLAGIGIPSLSPNAPVDPRKIALLAMYRPIHDLPGIGGMGACADEPAWALLFKQAVTNVLTERAERARIESLGPIDDETSRAVRQMYEENPYPRWFSMDRFPPVSLAAWIARPLSVVDSRTPPGDPARILVAGCGTGKEACELALDIAHAQVLAVDLSLASLAYAKRCAHELGLGNIEFRQADLLNLGLTEGSFDLVSSSGVLHHMQRPELGLEALARQLRPGGWLRVALYSERARSIVNLARQHVQERGIRPDAAGIREFRQHLRDLPDGAPLKPLTRWGDFYSLSTCRDLIFHIMEHQYRLPQIDSMLRDAGLVPVDVVESLGPDVLAQYRHRFPHDPGFASFQNWDLFEQAHPNTFARMFSVRARKPENGVAQAAKH